MNTVEIKRILLLFATITLFSPAVMAADSLFENWVEHFGAYENSDESAYDLETDAAGNIYVTGISQVFGAADMVTLKYNADGVLQWQQLANLPMSVYPSRLERDNQGNIYSAGTYLFPGDPDLGSIAGPKPYLVKYDIDGNKLWDASHPIITAGFLVDLAISDNGGVYMGAMGESAGSSLFKYDSDGNQLWERFLPSNSRLNDLEVDQFGNAYLTAGYLPTFDSSSYRTWKFGNDGTLLWEARKYLWEDPDLFIFDDEIDVPWALTVDDDGNVYVAGTSWSRDAIIKYDALGDEVWTARYAGTGWEDARAIQTCRPAP